MLAVAISAHSSTACTSIESKTVEISCGYSLLPGLKNSALQIQTRNSDYIEFTVSHTVPLKIHGRSGEYRGRLKATEIPALDRDGFNPTMALYLLKRPSYSCPSVFDCQEAINRD